MSENKHVDPLEDTRAESIRPGKLLVGAPIGGYLLQHVLGEGGMGVVWCAHDPLLDRTIAIKVLKSRDVGAAMRTRLLREAQAMAQIKHPNVLTVHRVGTEADRDFIVMELVDGGPLDHWLAFGPSDAEVMEALLAAGRGLAAAHAAGLVHRDFKPNNVLRSKEGRILVTDFGLARGLGEEWTAPIGPSGSLDPDVAATSPSSRDSGRAPGTRDSGRGPGTRDSGRGPGTRDSGRGNDNVLDSPLTKTGALIGTPAYMAPEQFTGAEPDPRTDQFAFCVTAWQALTGARPHFGRTLDELRQAANAGVGAVVTNLSKQMRAVLVRGLDPDPKKRWPDLVTLLREIERAGRPPKPKWPWVAGGAALVIAAAVIAYVATRSAPEPPCPPVEVAWSDAWTGKSQDVSPWIATLLDDRRTKWTAAYDQTCKAPRPEGRLGCLRVMRDRIAAVATLAKDPAARATLDPFTLLAPVEACSSRLTIAGLPDDRASMLLLAQSAAAPTTPGLEAKAKAAGWTTLVPVIALASGLDRIHRGDLAYARTELEHAAAAAGPLDVRLTALARLALLELSLRELAHPDAKQSVKSELHDELAKQLTYAQSAVKAAGDEPVLVGHYALLEADALADQAERGVKKAWSQAIARVEAARKEFDSVGDVRRGALAAALYAEIQWRRGDPGVLGEAEFAARWASDALERAKLPVPPALDRLLGAIAFARGDTAAAHRWLDRTARFPRPPSDGVIEGVVVGPDGKPVMNAVVVAWTGELHGDPLRAITDRSTLDGELVETGIEGKFTIHARRGSALLAEASGGALRSIPVGVQPQTRGVVIKLGPTAEVAGRLDADGGNPDIYARFATPQAAWLVHVPIDRSGGFRLTNLPPGTWQLGAIGRSGTGVRRARGATITVTDKPLPVITNLAWVVGRPIDVVVRGASGGAMVWIGDHAMSKLPRRDEIETFASYSVEIASSPLIPIGSQYTEPGRAHYTPGALHAVLVGDFKNAVACVAPTTDPASKVICKKLEPDARAVAIDVP